ncbi:hypothetical protein NBRC116601_31090 [Cognatishimia sp. WU-CL00825]|uniref:hypothetical protein n=1 Tax=Cognatishimia sp. WU-CL00825 TaxID=3127658 RepID=UPI00310BDA97
MQDTIYTRFNSGRVKRQNTTETASDYDYIYDYAGRLLTAANVSGQNTSRTFTYRRGGSIASKSNVGTYDYTTSRPRQASKSISLSGGCTARLTYPHGNIRLETGALSQMHKDQLGSIRAETGANGKKDETIAYQPI